MEVSKKPKIGFTIGDLNGIGPELIIKALSNTQISEICTPIIYASPKVIALHNNTLKKSSFTYHKANDIQNILKGKVNLLSVWNEDVNINIGQISNESGAYAFKSLEAAVNDLKKNNLDAIVTAPIHKKAIQSDKFHFPGHTEYLASKDERDPLMFMLSEEMKIAVVTGHIPLSEVSSKITKELILEKLNLLNQSLKKDFFKERPKIAILGLNPHAGDKGLLGEEENKIIEPAIEEAKDKKIFAIGPYSSDAFFGNQIYKQFDAVLAMYHDQGLIPFKTLSFGKGVNFTAGLSFIRTSPDHGTAYDIAGKDKADIGSFRQAIYIALDIIRNRAI